MTRPGLLVTPGGESFRGSGIGASGIATGEVVFNTSMAGYQEVFTDPSYTGQVVVMTSPHIGNYGVTDDDTQSEHRCESIVIRSSPERPSNWRAQGDLEEFLVARGIVGLSEVDTRRLTRHIRQFGAMPVAVGIDVDEGELREVAAATEPMEGRDLASLVSTRSPYRMDPVGEVIARVVVFDLGVKRAILQRFIDRKVAVEVVPANTPAGAVLAAEPDGVFFSNGPGDPEPLADTIETLRELLGRLPVFGICLGHQVLGLALGASTFKLPFGHHGGNHPVRDLHTGRVAITAQNHGFAVDLWSLSTAAPPRASRSIPHPSQLPARVGTPYGPVEATHQNLNDGTLEGLRCLDVPAFGVQYHPEAAPGPGDADYLFDEFLALMGVN